ncbi:pre-toxin TG domain-containing protein, partial [Lactiplantibacillus herbarum]|uniref:pre-toxin TG domain-containing protein n=1 Tax=Lactiplantibacillus herbarum TaxID=1670446 RepID=UPI001ED9B187
KSSKKHKSSKKKKSSKKHKSAKKHKSSKKKKSSKKRKASGSSMIALVSRKTGISKSNVGMLADALGYNDLYTLITGKDAVTGKPRSRVLAGALTAFNFMPVSKVLAVAKFAKLIAVAGVAGKFAAHASVAHKAMAVASFGAKRAFGKAAEKKAAKLAMEKAQKKIAQDAAKKIGKNTAREVKHEATNRAGRTLSKAAKGKKVVKAKPKAKIKDRKIIARAKAVQDAPLYKHVKFPVKDGIVAHIYKNTEGHFLTRTKAHDKAIVDVVRDQSNFKRVDVNGNGWYAKTLKDGRQIWARVRDGGITDGGINSRAVPVLDSGMHKVSYYPELK